MKMGRLLLSKPFGFVWFRKKFWTEAILSQEVLFKTALGRCLFLGGRARGQMEKQQLLSHQFGFVWYQKGSGPEPLFHPWGLINFEEGLF
jgi:hypothetical protein